MQSCEDMFIFDRTIYIIIIQVISPVHEISNILETYVYGAMQYNIKHAHFIKTKWESTETWNHSIVYSRNKCYL